LRQRQRKQWRGSLQLHLHLRLHCPQGLPRRLRSPMKSLLSFLRLQRLHSLCLYPRKPTLRSLIPFAHPLCSHCLRTPSQAKQKASPRPRRLNHFLHSLSPLRRFTQRILQPLLLLQAAPQPFLTPLHKIRHLRQRLH
jgi:hypothetical protein